MNFLIRVAIIIGSIETAVFGIFTGCFSFLDPRFRSHGAGNRRAREEVTAERALLEFRTDAQRRDESLVEAAITADTRNLKYARFDDHLRRSARQVKNGVRDLLATPWIALLLGLLRRRILKCLPFCIFVLIQVLPVLSIGHSLLVSVVLSLFELF